MRVSLLGLIMSAKFSKARSSTLALDSEQSKLFMLGWPESPGSRCWLVEQFVETKTKAFVIE